jgi:hypothetical protein
MLLANEPVFGLWITLESPSIAEMAVALGLDWIVIDAEHGHLDWKEITEHLRAAVRSHTVALVRVSDARSDLIKRALDVGADGILVPWIQSADEARRAVTFARYPPEGVRGMGAERHLLGKTPRGACRGGQRARPRRADHRDRGRRSEHSRDFQGPPPARTGLHDDRPRPRLGLPALRSRGGAHGDRARVPHQGPAGLHRMSLPSQAHRFHVALTADFYDSAGSPRYRDLGLDVLQAEPHRPHRLSRNARSLTRRTAARYRQPRGLRAGRIPAQAGPLGG